MSNCQPSRESNSNRFSQSNLKTIHMPPLHETPTTFLKDGAIDHTHVRLFQPIHIFVTWRQPMGSLHPPRHIPYLGTHCSHQAFFSKHNKSGSEQSIQWAFGVAVPTPKNAKSSRSRPSRSHSMLVYPSFFECTPYFRLLQSVLVSANASAPAREAVPVQLYAGRHGEEGRMGMEWRPQSLESSVQ